MEYETGNFATNNNVKLKDFAYEWLDFIKSEISEETINRYKLDIELRILPKLGNYKLKDLNVYIIDKFKKDASGIFFEFIFRVKSLSNF